MSGAGAAGSSSALFPYLSVTTLSPTLFPSPLNLGEQGVGWGDFSSSVIQIPSKIKNFPVVKGKDIFSPLHLPSAFSLENYH